MPEFVPTDEQSEILAHSPGSHGRILAGPGTGKSATLVALTNRLIQAERRIRIRMLTFTRAATAELAKIVAEHPAAAAERPSTIHSFSISVLLRNPGVGGFPEPLRIADDWEDEEIIRPTLAQRAGVQQRRLDVLLRELASNWESLTEAQDPRVTADERSRFMGAWYEHRQVLGYTLLAELPFALRNALTNHPDLEGCSYDLLVVDEYQDLNACDLEVIRLIADRECSILGAGDDDQSIYSFRKADPEGIRRFPDDYPGSRDYPLSKTLRCSRRIVEWARYVIEGDPDRPHRPPLTPAEDAPEGETALLSFPDETNEARGVARLVRHLIEDESVSAPDVLILVRSNYRGHFSRPFEQALAQEGIAFADPDAVKNMLADEDNRRVLEAHRLLAYRPDSLAWAALLELTDGIGERFFEYLYESARNTHQSFGQRLLDLYGQEFPGAPSPSGTRATEMISEMLAWLDEHSAPASAELESGWGEWMLSNCGHDPISQPTDELTELLLSLDELMEPDIELGRYLGQIQPLGKDKALAESEGVRIMTMGGAKGLTVEAAILAGVEEGIVPRPNTDLGEERRLLYVGMTRAKRFLYITWARRRRGPTARSGRPRVGGLRNHSTFLEGGPVDSRVGTTFVRERWGS